MLREALRHCQGEQEIRDQMTEVGDQVGGQRSGFRGQWEEYGEHSSRLSGYI